VDSRSDSLEIRRTPLGRGVFVKSPLGPQVLVGEVTGTVWDERENESVYRVDLGGNTVLEPDAPFRFLNHHCDPNCELILSRYRYVNRHRVPRLWLQTLRAIAPGEELTIDYGWPAWGAIPCSCGSSKCRGWIVSLSDLHKLSLSPSDSHANSPARRS
jgi:uncharacterized protein